MGRKPANEYDVFVSYAEKDRRWVKDELLPRLSVAKLRTFIDFDHFQPGAVRIDEFERGINSSRRTLLLFSPNYLVYDLGQLSNILSRNLDPSAKNRRCIPVKIKHCDIPERLRYLVPCDLTSDDFEQRQREWNKLISSLRVKRDWRNPSLVAWTEDRTGTADVSDKDLDMASPKVSTIEEAIQYFCREEIFPSECDEITSYLSCLLTSLDDGNSLLHKRYAIKPQIEDLNRLIEKFRNDYPKVSVDDKVEIVRELRDISEEIVGLD